ncbi:MAG: hypothetical protein KDC61_04610 [Saprospiraceae bacterium]|nr:hypothetical protein [Saprospiraceae bacterium]MCB9353687.1 hypothetical protein [Lewinellaceae bacterium]
MHNTDRVVPEFENEYGFELDEFENEFDPEYEEAFEDVSEFSGEDYESPLSELNELELATELLGVTNEAQMDEFMHKLVKKSGPVAREAMKRRPFWNFLRRGLGKLVPIAGRVVGGLIGGPLGARIGGKIGTGAARLFRLELEGLSPEDQEFELARAYVNFASNAAQKAALNHRKGMDPKKAVQKALAEAASIHAPGLLETNTNELGGMEPRHGSTGSSSIPAQGTWFRRGDRIYLKVGT